MNLQHFKAVKNKIIDDIIPEIWMYRISKGLPKTKLTVIPGPDVSVILSWQKTGGEFAQIKVTYFASAEVDVVYEASYTQTSKSEFYLGLDGIGVNSDDVPWGQFHDILRGLHNIDNAAVRVFVGGNY